MWLTTSSPARFRLVSARCQDWRISRTRITIFAARPRVVSSWPTRMIDKIVSRRGPHSGRWRSARHFILVRWIVLIVHHHLLHHRLLNTGCHHRNIEYKDKNKKFWLFKAYRWIRKVELISCEICWCWYITSLNYFYFLLNFRF